MKLPDTKLKEKYFSSDIFPTIRICAFKSIKHTKFFR